MPMKMEGLNDAGVVKGRRNLRRIFRKMRRETFADPLDFEKVAAIVRPQSNRRALDAGNQLGRIERRNHVPNALFALWNGYFDLLDGHACLAAARVSGSVSVGRLPETRFAARSR